MSTETRGAPVYGQLQEGLRFELVRTLAVSGVTDCNGLCLVAKNEAGGLEEEAAITKSL